MLWRIGIPRRLPDFVVSSRMMPRVISTSGRLGAGEPSRLPARLVPLLLSLDPASVVEPLDQPVGADEIDGRCDQRGDGQHHDDALGDRPAPSSCGNGSTGLQGALAIIIYGHCSLARTTVPPEKAMAGSTGPASTGDAKRRAAKPTGMFERSPGSIK